MIKKHIWKTVLTICLGLNLISAGCGLQTNPANDTELISGIGEGDSQGASDLEGGPDVTETPPSTPENTGSVVTYSGYEVSQIFLGKWRITECLNMDFHRFRPSDPLPNLNAIVGEEIEFGLTDVIFYGEKHKYAKGPITCCLPLFSGDRLIGANYAKTMGITGDCFSVVVLELPGAHQCGEPGEPYEVKVNDIRSLILKDSNTMFASAESANYKLERVTEE